MKNSLSVKTAMKEIEGGETVLVSEISNILDEQISLLEKTDPNAGAHRFHLKRYATSLSFLPDVQADVLDLGGGLGLFADVLKAFRRYRLFGADRTRQENTSQFDFERDSFPFGNAQFDLILFMEVLEHLREDPMHAISEINRILRPGGLLLLTTPNICSWRAIQRALMHENPALFPPYLRHGGTDRHNREYTFKEVIALMTDGGFSIVQAEALDVYDHLPPAVPVPGFDMANRGDTVFCLAQKQGSVCKRQPNWLYWPNEG